MKEYLAKKINPSTFRGKFSKMQKQDDDTNQIMKEDFEQLSNFSIDFELEEGPFSNLILFKSFLFSALISGTITLLEFFNFISQFINSPIQIYSLKIFMKKFCQKTYDKSRRQKVEWNINRKGLLLTVNSKPSSKYYRVY